MQPLSLFLQIRPLVYSYQDYSIIFIKPHSCEVYPATSAQLFSLGSMILLSLMPACPTRKAMIYCFHLLCSAEIHEIS